MKLSIYEFRGLRRVYAIIELEGEERGLVDALRSLDEKGLLSFMERVFGKVRTLKYGNGAYLGDSRVDFFYAEVELDDYSIYRLEVYPGAATVIADSTFADLSERAKRLVREAYYLNTGGHCT